MSAANAQLTKWSRRFQKTPLASKVVTSLERRSGEIWRRTFDLLQSESPEYRNSVDDEFTKESRSHCKELLSSIIAIAAGRAAITRGDPFTFVRTHAQWRAKHQVPLIASLHAYRLAHKTYWGITQEALLRHPEREEALFALTMLSEFWIEFFDHVGAVLAEAHTIEEGLTAAQDARSYSTLIDDLLRGVDRKGGEAQRLCALCGIRTGSRMAVAVARPFSEDGKLIDLEVTRRSLVRLVREAIPSAAFGKLVDIRNDDVVAIVSSEANTARSFSKLLRRHGLGKRAASGLRAGFGISLETTDVARLPESLEEARLALEFASPATPLMHFSDIGLPEFLIRRADKTAVRLIPEWVRHLAPPDGGRASDLTQTIRAFADSSLNVKQTARRLGVHTNTVYFRLNRIHTLTGVDARTFSGVTLLLTVLRLKESAR